MDHHDIVGFLRDLVRIDTTNPPGNEIAACRYIEAVLRTYGLESTIYEPAPGRGSIVARLKGDGSKKPLLLLSHLDVVGAQAEAWSRPPFSGDVKDGIVFGRGSLDCKNLTAIEMAVVLALAQKGVTLKRDIILAATADEESGGRLGAGWLASNAPEQISSEYCINEGGGFGLELGHNVFYTCAAAEKGSVRLRLRAKGEPGHAAVPRRETAIERLSEAVLRLSRTHLPIHPEQVAIEFITGIARVRGIPDSVIKGALSNPALCDWLLSLAIRDHTKRMAVSAMLRNTASPTIVKAGYRINVIPEEATAEVDGRILPGQTPGEFLREVRAVVGGLVEVEEMSRSGCSGSPTGTELFRIIAEVISQNVRGARVLPLLLTGCTDARYTRPLGAVTYGFCPLLPGEAVALAHGIDERCSVASLEFGFKILYEVVERLCA